MSEAASPIELETFERMDVGPKTALLRFAGRTSSDSGPAEPPVLIVEAGAHHHRISALPAPPPPGGTVRAAYPASLDVLEAADGFALELSDRSVLPLPRPIHRHAATTRAQRPASEGPAELEAKLERERAAVQLLDRALTDREAKLAVRELALKAAGERLASAQREVDELRSIAASLAGELDEARTREEMLGEVVRAETAKREGLLEQFGVASAARGGADAEAIETIRRSAEARARDQAWREIQAAERRARRRSRPKNRRGGRPQAGQQNQN